MLQKLMVKKMLPRKRKKKRRKKLLLKLEMRLRMLPLNQLPRMTRKLMLRKPRKMLKMRRKPRKMARLVRKMERKEAVRLKLSQRRRKKLQCTRPVRKKPLRLRRRLKRKSKPRNPKKSMLIFMKVRISQLIQFQRPQIKKPTQTTASTKSRLTEPHIQMLVHANTLKTTTEIVSLSPMIASQLKRFQPTKTAQHE